MRRLIFLILFLFFFVFNLQALEEIFSDLPCSVEVSPIFSLSLDKNHIDFGLVEPGSKRILGEGGFFNELRCRSNYGRTWYLKVNFPSPPKLLGGKFYLPKDTFRIRVNQKISEAEPLFGLQFDSLDKESKILYISQKDENDGKEVILRFQYMFSVPEDAPAGNYQGQIIFTMTETP